MKNNEQKMILFIRNVQCVVDVSLITFIKLDQLSPSNRLLIHNETYFCNIAEKFTGETWTMDKGRKTIKR